MLTAEEVKEFALKEGADIVGIADALRVPESYPPRPPQRLMPEAKAVVVFGVAMLGGGLESGNWHVANAQTIALYHEVSRIGYRIGRFLEKAGYRALMVSPAEPFEMSRETRGLVAELSLRHCAVAAGLGVLGKSRLLLTRDFGPRVNLGAVVTNAPLPADSPLEEELCSECRTCIDNCPAKAISEEGQVDTVKCLLHSQRYGLGNFIRYLTEILPKPVEEKQKALRDPEFWRYYQRMICGVNYNCAGCVLECPLGQK